MDLGVTFASLTSLGPAAAPRVARLAEQLGYRSFWTAEATGPEAFSILAAAGAAAPSLDLGTGVVAIQVRSPMLAAMAAATVQALHPNVDVALGIGISSPVVTRHWHGVDYTDRPIAQMREYIELVRLCLGGDPVTFDGDYYRIRRSRLGIKLGERRPRIVLAALNATMLSLAGEAADGVLLNYLPASHVPWSVEQVRKGEAATGRPSGDTTIYGYVHVGVGDPEAARPLAKRDLFSYAVVDSYARNFARAGFADEVAHIRERFAAGDRDGAIEAVSDGMADAINVVGDADDVRRAVQAYVDGGIDAPVVMPLPWGDDRWATVESTLKAAVSGLR
ncbi:MAG: LLM class F420-dependent oxidoreductase [Acidimicrobiales bacterium]